jgi:ribonuclease P protein component
MIANTYRFHGHGGLRYVYKRGKNVRGQYFSLKFAPNNKRDSYRLAVVVSKKVSKLAVVRNRIRRRIYEVVRKNQDRITGPYDVVITVYSEQLMDMPSQEIEKLIIEQLSQSGVISYR